MIRIGEIFQRKGSILLGNLKVKAHRNHYSVNFSTEVIPAVVWGCYIEQSKQKNNKPESSISILVLCNLPLCHIVLEKVCQIVFLCLEINGIL